MQVRHRLYLTCQFYEGYNENVKKGGLLLKLACPPLIKDRGTIDRRLDGKVKNAKKEHLRVLLPAEEKEIVQFVKKQEQSLLYKGVSKKQVSELIVDVLRIRQHVNMKAKESKIHLFVSPSDTTGVTQLFGQ